MGRGIVFIKGIFLMVRKLAEFWMVSLVEGGDRKKLGGDKKVGGVGGL